MACYSVCYSKIAEILTIVFFLNIVKSITQYFWLHNLHKTCRDTLEFHGVCSIDCIWSILGYKLEVIFSNKPKTNPLFSTFLGIEIPFCYQLLLSSRNLLKPQSCLRVTTTTTTTTTITTNSSSSSSSSSNALALELSEPSEAFSVWVKSHKFGSSLECGVLHFTSLHAPSPRHLLAFHIYTVCRTPSSTLPDTWTAKTSNCSNILKIGPKKEY